MQLFVVPDPGDTKYLPESSYSEQRVVGVRERGELLLKQVPPQNTEHGGGKNVVLQRTLKLGGENRALKLSNWHSGVVPYGKICSRSLHCTPRFSAGRYDPTSHGNFLAHVGIGFLGWNWKTTD